MHSLIVRITTGEANTEVVTPGWRHTVEAVFGCEDPVSLEPVVSPNGGIDKCEQPSGNKVQLRR